MSENRVSNETLGKVMVQVVKDLQKSLKTHEKIQSEQQTQIREITNKAVLALQEELDRVDRFSIDLKPLDEKMKDHIKEIEKASEKAKKEFKTPILEMKVIGIFAFVLLSVLGFGFLTNQQAKDVKKERDAKEHFMKFINADEKRVEEYKNWVNE